MWLSAQKYLEFYSVKGIVQGIQKALKQGDFHALFTFEHIQVFSSSQNSNTSELHWFCTGHPGLCANCIVTHVEITSQVT